MYNQHGIRGGQWTRSGQGHSRSLKFSLVQRFKIVICHTNDQHWRCSTLRRDIFAKEEKVARESPGVTYSAMSPTLRSRYVGTSLRLLSERAIFDCITWHAYYAYFTTGRNPLAKHTSRTGEIFLRVKSGAPQICQVQEATMQSR